MAGRGFVPKRKIYTLEYDTPDHPYEGLCLRVRSVPMNQFMALAAMADGFDIDSLKDARDVSEVGKDAAAQFTRMRTLFEAFSKALISWNVEESIDSGDDDSPLRAVPPTLEGVMSQDFDMVMFLVMEWIGAMGGVPDFSVKTPNSGALSPGGESPETALADLSRPLSSARS